MIGIPRVDSGCQLLLHLDGNSNDSSPNAYNGTDTNVSYGSSYGKSNQGAHFVQASGSKISLGATANLVLSGDFTMHFWSNPTSPQPDPYARACIDKSYYPMIITDGGAYNNGWTFQGNALTGVANTVSFGVKQWMCITRVGTTLSIYKNGSLIASGTDSGSIGSGNAYICSQSGTGRYFSGDNDELYVNNSRGWSAAEVKRWYAWATGKLM